jgi:FKBP-type peptidyl-prolyl cis-trans isomerase (trigger factor)
VIDFTGRKNGEEFPGGKASDYPVMVGGGMMLPDFEAQMVGVKAGESKTFDVDLPRRLPGGRLAGNTVQFEMTVKKVEAPACRRSMPISPSSSASPTATSPRCAPRCGPTWSAK